MRAALGPGSTFDEWTIESRLGEGGMACVFVAVSPAGQRVALKVLTLDDELIVQRFGQESRLLSQVRHPHLVQVFETGSSEGTPWMAMELLAGRSLSEVLRSKPFFTLDEALPLFAQLSDALSALHRARVVHRDLKPGNVMVSEVGWVTLLDLGIAREGEGGLTRTGMVFGTPGYMAPEQILADKNITPAADVYAFAVMLWRALTGQPPFRARGESLLVEHLKAPRPLLSEVRPELPAALTPLFVSALAVDPAQRPQTMGALWDELERALDGVTRVPTRRADLQWLSPQPQTQVTDRDTGPTPRDPTHSELPAVASTSARSSSLSPVSSAPPATGRAARGEATRSERAPRLEPTRPDGRALVESEPEPTASEGHALPLAPLGAPTHAQLAPVLAPLGAETHAHLPAVAEPTAPEGRALLQVPITPEPTADDGAPRRPMTMAELDPVAPVPPPPLFSALDERTLWGIALVLGLALITTLLALFIDDAPAPPEPTRITGVVAPPPVEAEVPQATPDLVARQEKLRADTVPFAGLGRDGFSIDKVREVRPQRFTAMRKSAGAKGAVEIIVLIDGRPVRADVEVDGRFAGIAPVATRVGVGKHVGRVDLDKHLPTKFEFWSAGQPLKLEIELTPLR